MSIRNDIFPRCTNVSTDGKQDAMSKTSNHMGLFICKYGMRSPWLSLQVTTSKSSIRYITSVKRLKPVNKIIKS